MEEKLVLVSGYGVPGEDDIALYGIAGERAVKRFGLYHGRAPSFCCKGDDGVVYAASERADGADITAYDIWEEGLRAIRTLEVPGRGLCHLCAHEGVVFGCCFESGHYFAVDAALTRVLWQLPVSLCALRRPAAGRAADFSPAGGQRTAPNTHAGGRTACQRK